MEITTDPVILGYVSGFKIPSLPPSRPYLPEPVLSSSDSVDTAEELNRLLRKGAIRRAEFSIDQFLSPYFLIDKSSGGKRFILNLKKLNEYIEAPHFTSIFHHSKSTAKNN